MKNLKHSIIVLTYVGAFASFTGQPADAQTEISFGVGGGMSLLKATTDLPTTIGFGGEVGFGFTYFWGGHWGIGTGVGAALCNGAIDADSAKSYNLGLRETSSDRVYDLRTTLIGYRENLNAIMLTIPLMLRFRSNAAPSAGGLRLGIGVKVGLPFKAGYRADAYRLYNTGWFPDFEVEVDMPTFGGFGTFDRPEVDGSLKLKPAFMASVEIGYEWQVAQRLGFYAGAYIDYGLNDIRSEASAPFVVPNAMSPADFTTRQIVVSTDENQAAFVGKLSPLAAGIMVKLTFSATGDDKMKAKKTIWRKTVSVK